jgi:glyoxylase-like metal-dependent hydrolase (beta-lactamase superfamily II)
MEVLPMQITRRNFSLAALGGMLAAPSVAALAKAPMAGAQAPGIHRLKVGAFEVTVLNDGTLPLDTKIFSGDQEAAGKMLQGAYLPKDSTPTAINEWLVNTGDKLVLIDTGTSNLFGPSLGRMAKNLVAAGVDPAAVDEIVLTHLHPDHSGGLLTPDKAVAFPNASVHVNDIEYAFWMSDDNRAKAPDAFKPFFDMPRASIKPYADAGKVSFYKDGAEFLPGISAILAPGHTVGHTMVRLSSNGSQLLLWTDIVHNATLQFPEPERSIAFDTDPAMAVATRKKVFDMVATDKLLIAGTHLDFPGIGHVVKASSGYAYVPMPWNSDL